MISIKVNHRQLGDLVAKLGAVPNGLASATAMAGNKTLTSTRAHMVRVIRERYSIKAGDIRQELEIRRLTVAKLAGMIRGESSPGVPLLKFARTKAIPSTRRTKAGGYTPKGGISVLVRRDRGKRIVPGAFTARMASGHVGVFRRGDPSQSGRRGRGIGALTGQSKLGRRYITELYGPTPVKLLGAEVNLKAIEQQAQATMDKNLQHEVEFYLGRNGLR